MHYAPAEFFPDHFETTIMPLSTRFYCLNLSSQISNMSVHLNDLIQEFRRCGCLGTLLGCWEGWCDRMKVFAFALKFIESIFFRCRLCVDGLFPCFSYSLSKKVSTMAVSFLHPGGASISFLDVQKVDSYCRDSVNSFLHRSVELFGKSASFWSTSTLKGHWTRSSEAVLLIVSERSFCKRCLEK